MTITYQEKGPWMHDEIARQGHWIRQRGSVFESNDDIAVQAIIDSFDPLPYAKVDKIAELKREAANRANSIYGFLSGEDEETEPSDVGAFMNFAIDNYNNIKSNARNPLSGRLLEFKNLRDAMAAAISEINALTTLAEIEAYDVVTGPAWP